MRIALYAPFKPLDHPNPSGDQTAARALAAFLASKGHELVTASTFRARGLGCKPWLWPAALMQRGRAARLGADVWLTCHAYHKAPDVIGPAAARAMGAPYAVFQGAYSTRPGRSLRTWPGFALNRAGLSAAGVVFANRLEDLRNLRRLLPEDRLCYVRPGIDPAPFLFDPQARSRVRVAWGAGRVPVVLSVAMFRPGVKEQSLTYLLERLGALARSGLDFRLVLAGDGPARGRLEDAARRELPGRTTFLGRVDRGQLGQVYSAADVFAYPGIRESLGMVYLEAQAAGLPVVAFDNGGVGEVVQAGRTGVLTRAFDHPAYESALAALLTDPGLRRAMGRAGAAKVAAHHDAATNFARVERRLCALAGRRPR